VAAFASSPAHAQLGVVLRDLRRQSIKPSVVFQVAAGIFDLVDSCWRQAGAGYGVVIGVVVLLDLGIVLALLGDLQRKLSEDEANVFLFSLPKVGVWNAKLSGLWENQPIFSNDLTGVFWRD
jgi:hypothetical protein